ncbi:MAG: CapA family protein [Tissierellia bacterium]|nr:CapA family protein [Tissierellia bacterium]
MENNNFEASKISFIGDLMCEKPFLRAVKKNNYNFDGVFSECKGLFSKSELLVGNLETPIDDRQKYSKDMYIFNAPSTFLKEIKNAGIDFVTTATNHVLDRGIDGLLATIDNLEKAGIDFTGTFASREDKRYGLVELKNKTKLAIFSYTYGTNFADNKVILNEENYYNINFLNKPNYNSNKEKSSLRIKFTRIIPKSLRIKVNKILGRPFNKAYVDKLEPDKINQQWLENINKNISKAKKEADYVIVCPHMGGQFNTEHGSYVDFYVDLFKNAGADFVIANHPHLVQEFKAKDDFFVAYSLGNATMSLNTSYILKQDLPEYSIMINFYVKKDSIDRISFSILKEVEDKTGFIKLWPLDRLYKNTPNEDREKIVEEATRVYNRFLNSKLDSVDIEEEYFINI